MERALVDRPTFATCCADSVTAVNADFQFPVACTPHRRTVVSTAAVRTLDHTHTSAALKLRKSNDPLFWLTEGKSRVISL